MHTSTTHIVGELRHRARIEEAPQKASQQRRVPICPIRASLLQEEDRSDLIAPLSVLYIVVSWQLQVYLIKGGGSICQKRDRAETETAPWSLDGGKIKIFPHLSHFLVLSEQTQTQ